MRSQAQPSLMSGRLAAQAHKDRVALLVVIALASILAWQTGPGRLLLYPFTILATWFHEMGHGLAAMLAGRGFERLLIFADGSGVALTFRPADGFGLTDALVAASGPLGPAIAGALLILSSRSARATRTALAVLGIALIASTLIWVRSPIGWLILPALGAAILLVALGASDPWRRFAIQFLGVQAAISAWQQYRLSLQPRRTCRRPTPPLRHRRHRRRPPPALLGLGRGDQRGDPGHAVGELQAGVRALERPDLRPGPSLPEQLRHRPDHGTGAVGRAVAQEPCAGERAIGSSFARKSSPAAGQSFYQRKDAKRPSPRRAPRPTRARPLCVFASLR